MARDWTRNVDLNAIDARLGNAPHGAKTAMMQQIATYELRVSPSTLYRALQDLRGKRKEVSRDEQVSERLVDAVAWVKAVYTEEMALKNSTRTLPTGAAMRIAAGMGYPEVMDWAESTYNAALRRRGHHLPEARVRYEADYACQQMQVDFSRSKHFQMVGPETDEAGRPTGDWLLQASRKELHYKAGEVKLRTWLVQMVDEHSRARLVRAYAATSESGLLLLRFLRWAWGRPEDAHLMRDLPERLKGDQGAALKRREVRYLCEKLDIEIALAGVENSASQGKVERGFRSLWTFETEIATQLIIEEGEGAQITLSDLNQRYHEQKIRELEKEHPVREGKRSALYLRSIQERPPRAAPEDILEVAARTWERRADDACMISIRGHKLQVPTFAAGQWVRVHRNANMDFIGELVDGYRKGEYFKVEPYNFRSLGDFEGRAERTYRQEIAADVRAEFKRRKADGSPRALRPPAAEAPAASPFKEAEKNAAPAPLTLSEARREVYQALKRAGFENIDIDHRLRDGMTHDDVQELVDMISIHQHRRKAI